MDLAAVAAAISAASLVVAALVYREVRRLGDAVGNISKRVASIERMVDRLGDRVDGIPKRLGKLEEGVAKRIGEARRESQGARRAAEAVLAAVARLIPPLARTSINVYRAVAVAEELRLSILDRIGGAKLRPQDAELVQGALSVRVTELGAESARALMSLARRLAASGDDLGWDLYAYAVLALAIAEAQGL